MSTTCWLRNLNSAQLHRLAVLVGSNCSGTKAVRIDGIRDSLLLGSGSRRGIPSPGDSSGGCATAIGNGDGDGYANGNGNGSRIGTGCVSDDVIRLVSVDMGIKNLAYAFLTVSATSNFDSELRPSAMSTDTEGLRSAQDGAVKSQSLPQQWFHTAGSEVFSKPGSITLLEKITLQAWKKIDISSSITSENSEVDTLDEEESSRAKTIKSTVASYTTQPSSDAYHPSVYATHAYNFVSSILRHNPTHIIIERQRFRSGGGASVQEWSLRVGMFEAMLWAVLKTKIMSQNPKGEGHKSERNLVVESVLPARINRYWLEQGLQKGVEDVFLPSFDNDIGRKLIAEFASKGSKLTGRDMKKAKIIMASALLSSSRSSQQQNALGQPSTGAINKGSEPGSWRLEVGPLPEVQEMTSYFLNEVQQHSGSQQRRKANRASSLTESDEGEHTINNDANFGGIVSKNLPDAKITKLDDLADCFLQGVAWLRWRRNRIRVLERGEKAFNLKKE